MPLESATYVSGLNSSNPVAGDGVSAGDDHIRLVKLTLVNSFPAVAGAVTASHTELNYVDGVTSNIQTQIDSKAATGHGHAISDTTGLQAALDAKQAASTAITIANIGSQSVNYAASAGSYGGTIPWTSVTGRPTAVSAFTNDSGYQTSGGSVNYATSAGSVSGTGSNGYGTRTVSTSDPSGGSDGDVWYKY
jgi:hypothetical protein